MLKLPIGSQTFDDIISQNAVYVDKTQYLYQLIQPTITNKYFVSRPRRFGKSVAISTLHALFSGKKQLFDTLWITEKTDYEFPVFPVLHFDFSALDHTNAHRFETHLIQYLLAYASDYEVTVPSSGSLRQVWYELIEQVSKKVGKVVILVDEYDKPILDYIMTPKKSLENRDILRGFYDVIKASDAHLRFVFITGITKFSNMNIFSGLNNLMDISLQPDFAGLFGYTPEELTTYFDAHLTQFSQNKKIKRPELLNQIKQWYNGFRFTRSETVVYNPFSTLMLLHTQHFGYHWFSTGTPTYLMQLVQSEKINVTEIDGERLTETQLDAYNLDSWAINFPALLFQTGYLTITDYNNTILTLGYPNNEVKAAFTEHLISSMSCQSTKALVSVVDFQRALEGADIDKALTILKLFFAKIPYDIQLPLETYYQSLFYLIFVLLGTRIRAEVRTHSGRIDALVETKSILYVFEFKLNGSAQEALSQIDDKNYAFSFSDQTHTTLLVGVSFDTKQRNIVDYQLKTI